MKIAFYCKIVLFFIYFVVVGCSDNSDRMRIFYCVGSRIETKVLEKRIDDALKLANPAVEFNFEPITGNYAEKIQLMLGMRSWSDLFFLKDFLVPAHMSFDVLATLDNWIASEPVGAETFICFKAYGHEYYRRSRLGPEYHNCQKINIDFEETSFFFNQHTGKRLE